jgi:hypothetical protein
MVSLWLEGRTLTDLRVETIEYSMRSYDFNAGLLLAKSGGHRRLTGLGEQSRPQKEVMMADRGNRQVLGGQQLAVSH